MKTVMRPLIERLIVAMIQFAVLYVLLHLAFELELTGVILCFIFGLYVVELLRNLQREMR